MSRSCSNLIKTQVSSLTLQAHLLYAGLKLGGRVKNEWGARQGGESPIQTLCIGLCGKMSDHVHLVSFQLHAGTMKMVPFYRFAVCLHLVLLRVKLLLKTDKGNTSA